MQTLLSPEVIFCPALEPNPVFLFPVTPPAPTSCKALWPIAVLVLLLVVGPWLWNTVVKHLVPGVRAARWYDVLGLSVLLSLVVPK